MSESLGVFDIGDGFIDFGEYRFGYEDDVILLEYTGLKDNTKWRDLAKEEKIYWLLDGNMPGDWRGKEIYEGDILKTNDHIDYVEWKDEFSGFKYHNDKSRMTMVDWFEHGQYSGVEIVGNIYENPKLLPELLKVNYE